MIGPTDLLHSYPAPHFKSFQGFLICCSERPKFQHHTELCSRRSTSLVSSSNLSQGYKTKISDCMYKSNFNILVLICWYHFYIRFINARIILYIIERLFLIQDTANCVVVTANCHYVLTRLDFQTSTSGV